MLYLRKPIASKAADILAALSELHAASRTGEGNRQSAFRLTIAGAPEMVARASRRGGLMRLLSADLYFGANPRPLRELTVALEALRRGIPVADPMGAMVQWVTPLAYRGLFLSRAISGMTLWETIRSADEPQVRVQVLDQARLAIEVMHTRGLLHADLNLHNLFVTKIAESPAVIILDLDKARLFDGPVPARLRRGNIDRLIRSARKLDPAEKFLDRSALSHLGAA